MDTKIAPIKTLRDTEIFCKGGHQLAGYTSAIGVAYETGAEMPRPKVRKTSGYS
jgi:hypothetical protein